MPRFIVNSNAQPNGDHEVHDTSAGCSFMPLPENRIDVGIHSSCHGAVVFARHVLPGARVNGCYYCCKACHTT